MYTWYVFAEISSWLPLGRRHGFVTQSRVFALLPRGVVFAAVAVVIVLIAVIVRHCLVTITVRRVPNLPTRDRPITADPVVTGSASFTNARYDCIYVRVEIILYYAAVTVCE